MSTHDQLALDGHAAGVVPSPREPGTGERRAASEQRQGDRDRWRASGLYVQPREHNEPEEERDR